ncbi:sensor histidine kinase [Eremococcus coleocola]|uniref:histidine kinase n=1 Tax=Eremococcus coleocola ACS-139-V-Col8 TaxID=908337 RepID=E4KLZ0_9LACT|nr:HAMP domain-containing sensor histidine kinase [Eremococcus coleocola]EFR32093.1 ATPase/histidine kinase/DNA gyrase B/HSP90 domain protein [Eremococcus coleocola ACS-139-V-Col8]
MNELLTRMKQPLSLKWKWAVFLFIVMSLIASVVLFFYQNASYTYFYKTIEDEVATDFMQIKTNLEDRSSGIDEMDRQLTITPEGIQRYNKQKELFQYINFLDQGNYLIRLYSVNNELVYQTETVEIPQTEISKSVQLLNYQNKAYMAKRADLVSKTSGQIIGNLEVIYNPTRFQSFIDHQRKLFMLLLLLSVLVAALASIALAIYFLRPLTYLNNSLDRVEEDSLSDIRVRKPETDDEWSDLLVHINRLLDKIDSYVSNQKRFVEDVSHELRTPVSIVEGHLKLLNRWGKDDPEILAESISASLQEITRMKVLVQEMLDLSRADHVDVDYKNEVTEIYTTAKQVYNNMKLIHPDFKFFLDSDDREGESQYVQMFRNHFEQILIILMDNAVKYSLDRKEIHLSISRSVNTVEIAVQDFGEGMNQEDQEKVFGRFYRVDKARSREKGGTGLGLSIAYQLIKSYRGQIRVDSVLGNGSIFYISLPLLEADSPLLVNKMQKQDNT